MKKLVFLFMSATLALFSGVSCIYASGSSPILATHQLLGICEAGYNPSWSSHQQFEQAGQDFLLLLAQQPAENQDVIYAEFKKNIAPFAQSVNNNNFTEEMGAGLADYIVTVRDYLVRITEKPNFYDQLEQSQNPTPATPEPITPEQEPHNHYNTPENTPAYGVPAGPANLPGSTSGSRPGSEHLHHLKPNQNWYMSPDHPASRYERKRSLESMILPPVITTLGVILLLSFFQNNAAKDQNFLKAQDHYNKRVDKLNQTRDIVDRLGKISGYKSKKPTGA